MEYGSIRVRVAQYLRLLHLLEDRSTGKNSLGFFLFSETESQHLATYVLEITQEPVVFS
jgi:hypothetical protein